MTTMPTTLRRTRLRSRRALRRGVFAGILTTMVALAVFNVVSGSHHLRASAGDHNRAPAVAAHTAQLTQWEAAVHPLILNGGQVVALGPRQGVQQLQSHEFSAAVNHHMAAGWVGRLTQLRAQLAAVKAPGFLADAQSLLDRSLAGYIAASQDLVAASIATGPRRTSLLNSADVAGRAADRLYDAATAAIATQRAHLGLPVDWSGSS